MLHALAKGGRIEAVRSPAGRVLSVEAFTREGWRLPGVTPKLFRKLKRKRAIASRNGSPHRITRRGLELVRSQPDNR